MLAVPVAVVAGVAVGAGVLLPTTTSHATGPVSGPVALTASVTRVAPADATAVGDDAHGWNTDSTSRTQAHTSGSGNTAVNVAGDGQAHQVAEQPRADYSQHNAYENNSRSDSHETVNSHNSSSVRDSHNADIHRPPYPPF